MKPSMAVLAAALTLGVAACDPADGAADTSAADTATPAEVASAPLAAAVLASPGAPVFAVLYPGGAVDGEPTMAQGAAGPGGLVTFRTEADPDAVIAFYRERAEAAGLASVMSMNQGEARAYGAARGASGARVEVVASPVEPGQTSVQLSWSAGR